MRPDARPGTSPGQPGFVRGIERLDQLLADPQPAAKVAAAQADAEELDGVYAMNLATIRKLAQTTQVEVARRRIELDLSGLCNLPEQQSA